LKYLKGRDDVGGLNVDGTIVLKERMWYGGLDSFGSRQGSLLGSCEHINKPRGSIKNGELLDKLIDS
jgi:hypothetical protein